MTTASATSRIDDDRVRVTTWSFDAGQETGQHTHEYDYIVVPVTGGTFTITDPDGSTRQMQQEAGLAYAGTAGTEHNVTNSGGVTAVFVEIELKP